MSKSYVSNIDFTSRETTNLPNDSATHTNMSQFVSQIYLCLICVEI